jgi:hypothetical protein
LAEQVQQQLGKSELVIITERVDDTERVVDVALLLAQMMKMGLPEILDQHLPKLPKRWQQEGLRSSLVQLNSSHAWHEFKCPRWSNQFFGNRKCKVSKIL